jgi:DHA2 family multidrug resistance protein
MLASSALLPPYLQDLGRYSVSATGLLMAPRGIGTMIAMSFAGRIAMRSDPRYLIAVGLALIEWSMWEMSRWTPQISSWHLMDTTFIQGVGMGMVFVPMNLVSFATLNPRFRTDGSAFVNLVRNLGSAIGVSITTTFLANSIQTEHARLAEHATVFNRALSQNAPSMFLNPQLPFGAQGLDAIVQKNAVEMAYSNDFLFMFWISMPAFLVLAFMQKPNLMPGPRDFDVSE